MSMLQASASWFKQNFTWSNSFESWRERVLELAIIAGGITLLLASSPLYSRSPATTLVLWSVWLFGTVVAYRLGWVHLFGPVLFYDMIRTSRRGRYFLVRCLYAGFLMLVLFQVWMSFSWIHLGARQQASQIAMTYFESFVLIQFIAVLVLTPAYVAGSVSEEKDRKTLEFLLATDLRKREIVLSKLGSRLANLFLFLLTGLPILSILQFLGGVDPDLVLASFAATGVTALGIASVSILQSVWYKRPRDSIAATYLIIIAYYVISSVLFGLHRGTRHWLFELLVVPEWVSDEWTIGRLVEGFAIGNVFITLFDRVLTIAAAGQLGTQLGGLLWEYSLFYLVVGLACVGLAIMRLRVLALRQSFGKVEKVRWYQRYRPPIGDLPMLWKELNVEGSIRINWMGWIVVMLLVALTVGIGVFMIGYFLWEFLVQHDVFFSNDRGEALNIWVRFTAAGVACLTLLGVAVRASTTVRTEIDRDTFDALITTPLSAGAMLFAKFVGSLFSVRLGWLWLGAILGLGVLTGGLHMIALPLFLGAWVVYACFFSVIGLWYSMVSKSSMRATVYTMLTVIGVSVGHWLVTAFCCFIPMAVFRVHGGDDIPEYIAKFQTGVTPPFVLWLLSYPSFDVTFPMGPREFGEFTGFALLGLFLFSMATVMMWFVLIVPRFRQLTRRDQTSSDEE